jgi:hypothetical protein
MDKDTARYFKVPMTAARALVDSSDGPELLAGYVVLNRWAIKPSYQFTAAGAQAIRTATGMSDFRSKAALNDLLALRFGDKGQRFLIEDTGKRIKNARKYRLGEWEGPIAYLPDILISGSGQPLSRLIQAASAPEIRRDALLMLLHVHANANYGEFLGVDPDRFIYKKWIGEGEWEQGNALLELGHAGSAMGLHFWLLREEPDGPRFSRGRNAETIYGDNENVMERFWAAHDLLVDIGMICRVVIVETCGTTYPLWIFSPAYREALKGTGIAGDLARIIYNAACRAGFDPDNMIIREATGDNRESWGTGLFFVATVDCGMPIVRTIYAPTFHAPTPMNMAGLKEMADRTADWQSRLALARKERAA